MIKRILIAIGRELKKFFWDWQERDYQFYMDRAAERQLAETTEFGRKVMTEVKRQVIPLTPIINDYPPVVPWSCAAGHVHLGFPFAAYSRRCGGWYPIEGSDRTPCPTIIEGEVRCPHESRPFGLEDKP